MSAVKNDESHSAEYGAGKGGSLRAGAAATIAKPARRTWFLLLLLVFATLVAYQPAWHGGMIWDDEAHITAGELRSPQGLWRIWTDVGATQQYYPLLHTAFWIMHRLWADEVFYYHLVNILLHALSAFLLAIILQRQGIPGAWMAAAVFALHPVQVESVAWISELKNTLSGVLFLGAALAYLRFDRTRERMFYGIGLAVFVLALLSKTVTAVLPAALLVVFWWQRGRLSLRRDVTPLLPLFGAGLAAGITTLWVERILIGAQGPEFQLDLLQRILIAGRAFWFYIYKLVWPANLVFIYPRWQISEGVWWQYLFPLATAALVAVLWLVRRRSRAPLAAVLFFGGALFPASGFFNLFPFRFSFVADHFQYLACISVIALVCAGLAKLVRRWRFPAAVMAAAGILLLVLPLAALTRNQSRQYRDAETLYRTTIRRNPSAWLAYGRLGVLEMTRDVDKAVEYFSEAVRIRPDFAENHYNLANALQKSGRLEEAVAEYEEALQLSPGLAEAHNNLGNALQRMGRVDDAVAHYREALRLDPNLYEAHNNLAYAHRARFRFADALREWRAALKINPDYPDAHYNLGITLLALGQSKEAIAEFREVLRLRPDFANAHNGLGKALQAAGRLEEAVAEYREALRLNPGYQDARANLSAASALLKKNE
jgi:tetratricopeptide (TPR) repeat protein